MRAYAYAYGAVHVGYGILIVYFNCSNAVDNIANDRITPTVCDPLAKYNVML